MTSSISEVGTLPASSAAAATSSASSSSSTDSNTMLDPTEFLQLLVAQLQNQDPTNPVDTSQFMNQTAMLSQVQTMNTMQTTLASLASAQENQQATSMIGKQVSYTDPSGNKASGVVSSVQLLNTGPVLQVGNSQVALANVTAVSTPSSS